jgi:hypothetical protein
LASRSAIAGAVKAVEALRELAREGLELLEDEPMARRVVMSTLAYTVSDSRTPLRHPGDPPDDDRRDRSTR